MSQNLNLSSLTTKPGYKHTSLGWIPEDWEIKEFDRFADIVMGQSPEGSTYNQNGNGTPLINGPTEFTELHPIKIQWTTSPTKMSKVGDILLCVRGSSTGRINISDDIYCIGRGVAAIRASKGGNTKFVTYIVSNAVNKILKLTTGSTFPNIDSQSLKGIMVPLPPLPEQKAIAEILGTWDSAIETTKLLIAEKERRKKWLMQQLLTGKKRLKGFTGEWKRVPVSSFSNEVSIRNADDNQHVVLSCTKYDGLVPSLEYFGRKVYSNDLSTYKVVPKYCFAYATNHIEEGSIGYQSQYDDALISPMYTVFKTDSTIDDDFLYRVLKSYNTIHEYQKRMEGSIDRRGGLRWEEFSNIKLRIPSLQEQSAIVGIFKTSDTELFLLNQKLDAMREQKKGLMQKLLTGQIRVR